MDYLRYYLGVVMQLTGIAGILAGGGWAWLGVAQLPLFALLDPLIGEDERERDVAGAPRREREPGCPGDQSFPALLPFHEGNRDPGDRCQKPAKTHR